MVLASAGETSCPRIEIWFGLLVAIEGVPGDAMTGYCDSWAVMLLKRTASPFNGPRSRAVWYWDCPLLTRPLSMAWLI